MGEIELFPSTWGWMSENDWKIGNHQLKIHYEMSCGQENCIKLRGKKIINPKGFWASIVSEISHLIYFQEYGGLPW